jgi:Asp-tRNA(Asn)/Glu-tRNA(Gln) amidotransferase A subunit family amidase
MSWAVTQTRFPTSFNELYGLRPSHGRIDLAGAMAMAPSFDVAGCPATLGQMLTLFRARLRSLFKRDLA